MNAAAPSSATSLYLRVSALRGWRRLVLVFLLGVLATGALPPLYGVFLLIPALTGLAWLVFSGNTKRAVFGLGWLFGLGHFSAGLYWIGNALIVRSEQLAPIAPVAVLGLAALLAFFPAFACLISYVSAKRLTALGRVFLFAALWALFEWLRGWVLTGFPWNPMGSVWTFSDGMIQSTAVVGVFGLSLITVFVATLPTVLANYGDWRVKPRPFLVLGTAGFFLIALWAAGTVRLTNADTAMVPGVHLRLVQPNIDQRAKWDPEFRPANFEEQIRLSLQAPKPGEPQPSHVLWSETAATYFIASDLARRVALARAAPKEGLIITGAPRAMPTLADRKYRVWNSLHAIDHDGTVRGTYDKFHLVPFGEYMPFREWIGISKLTAGSRDFSPGDGPKTLKLKGLPPVSPLICYEVIFPGQVIDRENRPDWILNLTNDGWYGVSAGPYQHFAAARLRAVEEGLPLVRVANTGISGVIDGYGRVNAKIDLKEEGILDSSLPRALSPTPFSRFGNNLSLALMALFVLLGIGIGRKSS